ncbi:hypothetical protein COOONC_13008 [Cooperia oncophora]
MGTVVVYPSLSTLPTPLQQNITGDPDLVFRLDFDVLADLIAKLLGSTTTAAASTASAAVSTATAEATTASASTASATTKGTPVITTVSPDGVTIPGVGPGNGISVVVLIDFTKSTQNNWDAVSEL